MRALHKSRPAGLHGSIRKHRRRSLSRAWSSMHAMKILGQSVACRVSSGQSAPSSHSNRLAVEISPFSFSSVAALCQMAMMKSFASLCALRCFLPVVRRCRSRRRKDYGLQFAQPSCPVPHSGSTWKSLAIRRC